jgi:hypothetical protein
VNKIGVSFFKLVLEILAMMNIRARQLSRASRPVACFFSITLCAACLFDAGCSSEGEPQGEPPPDEDIANVQQASVSCTTWTDIGYVDGDSFKITLVTVDGKPVEIRTANAYVVMQKAAAAAGVNISVVSGFRTYAEQQYLYNCYVNCNCNSCNLAAKPGYSNHESGHALDLNTSASGVLTWLNNNGAKYGFKRTVPSEAWHWEWWGGGPGGGPCDSSGVSTPCTVTATGKSGECMDSTECVAQGNHIATPGYCPGPSNYQCCTATSSPPKDAGTDTGTAKDSSTADTGAAKDSSTADTGAAKDSATDTNVTVDTGVAEDAEPGQDAEAGEDATTPGKDGATTHDAAVAQDSGPSKDAASKSDAEQEQAVIPVGDSGNAGGCRVSGGRASDAGSLAGLFVALCAAFASRRLGSRRQG